MEIDVLDIGGLGYVAHEPLLHRQRPPLLIARLVKSIITEKKTSWNHV